ncbi:MAG: FAD:protein FMN transferase [Lachnospiraceae bacterium]|nr:FAD:protein FMN transferase [Lachnospiraceae bacterium]
MKHILKRGLAAGFLLFIGIFVFLWGSNDNQMENQKQDSTTQSIFAMDTYMDLTAYGENSEGAVEAAIAEIHRLDALFSTGNETSEVYIINQEKSGVLSEDYAYLFGRSMELWETTNGIFDITVYPVMRAWGFVDKSYRVPEETELLELLDFVDTSKVVYHKETGRIELPMQAEIDFGGIAKGYTSMRVSQVMKEQGVESAIVNLGGNVQTVGEKPDGSKWKVAIKSPYEDIPYLGVLAIGETAVITSGGYERYFEEDGKRYHHIIDTRTGYPAQSGLISVTIVCEDGALADGLSTSLYVMGKDEAIAYWRAHHKEFEAVICTQEDKLYVTEGLQDCFTSQLEYEIVSAQ